MAELKKIAALVNSANNQLFTSLKTGTYIHLNKRYLLHVHMFILYKSILCNT
jgi:hypothetical protein